MARLTVTKDDLSKVLRSIAGLTSKQVLVGIPDTTTERNEDDAGPINNATLGYIHENGSPAANIPPRPFLIPGVAEAEDKIAAQLKAAARKALDGQPGEAEKRLQRAGMLGQNAAREKINSGDFEPLSESTLRARARKGRKGAKEELQRMKDAKSSGEEFVPNPDNARPLIDTGQLRNSITYVIRKL